MLRRHRHQCASFCAFAVGFRPWAGRYAHEIIPVFNDSILQEYEEVLSRKKFHFPTETVDFLISRLKSIGVNLAAVETLVGDFPDPKDVVFFEVAMEKNKTDETFLVTGNQKHFPQHPKVVTPAEMLRILDNL